MNSGYQRTEKKPELLINGELPVFDIGSRACDILMGLLRDCDQSWLTQWADSVIDWGAKAANSYFDYWTRQLDENQKMFLSIQGGILERILPVGSNKK